MKRKLFYGLMLISMGTMLTGCHMKHEWADATCTEPKTCTVGGETEGEALGHQWVDATCEEAKHCSVCGETEGEPLEHSLTEATYWEAAVCTVCNEVVGEPLPTFVDENGLEFYQGTSYTVQGYNYNSDNLSNYEFIDVDTSITDIRIDDAEEEGYQTVTISRTVTGGYAWTDGTENERLAILIPDFDIFDIYSGEVLPREYIWEDMSIENHIELEWKGETYTIGYTEGSNWTWGEWTDNNDGNWIQPVTWDTIYVITIPEDYDGLALYTRSLTKPPAESTETEEAEETAETIDDTEDTWGDYFMFRVSDIYELLNS